MIFHKHVKPQKLQDNLTMFLELAEKLAGIEFRITSGFRRARDNAHAEDLAVDIRYNEYNDSRTRAKILKGLTAAGFRRIGLYNRHIHADRSLTRTDIIISLGVSK